MASSKFLEQGWQTFFGPGCVSAAWAFCPTGVGDCRGVPTGKLPVFAPVITLTLGRTCWFWAQSLSAILLVDWLQRGEYMGSQVSPPVSFNSLVPPTFHLAEICWPFSITFSSFISPFISSVTWEIYLTFLYLNYLIYKMQNNGTYFIRLLWELKELIHTQH